MSTAVNARSGQPAAHAPAAAPHGSVSSGTLFLLYASIAGACGALSGVVGKIAVAASLAPQLADTALRTFARYTPALLGEQLAAGSVDGAAAAARLAFVVEVALRIAFFAANAYLTGQMWRFFLKSLSLGPTPVAQIINTGTNFAVSAFAGLVCFREEVTAMWAVGALLVVAGLALVVMDPEAAKATTAPPDAASEEVGEKKQQ